jgi:uncharacterized caspase-like protein
MDRELEKRLFQEANGRATLSACSLNEESHEWPERKHGVFTACLLEGLEGKADADGDRAVTVQEAADYVMRAVKDWAIKNGCAQTPRLRSDVSGPIVLTTLPRPLPPPRDRDYALLIGIDHYQSQKGNPLRYCGRDAQRLCDILTSRHIGAFPKDHVKVMTSGAEGDLRPTRKNIVSALSWLKGNAKSADLVVLYFAGYGTGGDKGSDVLLLPEDFDLQPSGVQQQSAIWVNEILAHLDDLKCRNLALFLDACRWNHVPIADGSPTSRIRTPWGRATAPQHEARGLLWGCKAEEASYEDEKGGVFSRYLCEGLVVRP